MKSLYSILILSTLGMASAHADLQTYSCTTINEHPESEVLRAKRTVIITETADITKQVAYGKKYDFVFAVNVKILSELRRSVTIEKSFKAVATSEDVVYTVSAVRAQGVKVGIFLDEMDQAYLEEISESGEKTSTRLSCTSTAGV